MALDRHNNPTAPYIVVNDQHRDIFPRIQISRPELLKSRSLDPHADNWALELVQPSGGQYSEFRFKEDVALRGNEGSVELVCDEPADSTMEGSEVKTVALVPGKPFKIDPGGSAMFKQLGNGNFETHVNSTHKFETLSAQVIDCCGNLCTQTSSISVSVKVQNRAADILSPANPRRKFPAENGVATITNLQLRCNHRSASSYDIIVEAVGVMPATIKCHVQRRNLVIGITRQCVDQDTSIVAGSLCTKDVLPLSLVLATEDDKPPAKISKSPDFTLNARPLTQIQPLSVNLCRRAT